MLLLNLRVMNIKNINITESIEQARKQINESKDIPVGLATLIMLLLTVLEILALRKNPKNSNNSSIPPSQDPNRAKNPKPKETKRKPGGQIGRDGKNLKPFEEPDEIIDVPVDLNKLPTGHSYHKVGVAKRQVVELLIKSHVKEYRLEIVEDENGKRFTAEGPEGSNRPVQYGNSVKAAAVYMSIYQLVPYARVQEYFYDQAGVPLSTGSLFNFNQDAFVRLSDFEQFAQEQLRKSEFVHADETSINLNGKKIWLHSASNNLWTLFMPHEKRGIEAMDAMDIIPKFKGILIHDHWTSYFSYKECTHALCNAHHLRELQAVIENEPNHTWAQSIKDLLLEINKAVNNTENPLKEEERAAYRKRYRDILEKGDIESPPPEKALDKPKKRGRIKKSKERNLLERLRNFEDETLRFMVVSCVPFTNNQGENDIRMTKVQQKISGCFKSIEGAKIFCRVRSYLLTAQKHGMSATDALNILFSGKLPDFCFLS